MINLNSKKIFIDLNKKNSKKKIYESIAYNYKNFTIYLNEFNISFYVNRDTSWDFTSEFKKFFEKIDIKYLKYFLYKSKTFNFEFDFVTKEFIEFADKYIGWAYLQFEFGLEEIFSIKEFHEKLNMEYNVYKVYDRDWPEIKIYFKEFTHDNIYKVFELMKDLLKINNKIIAVMEKNKRYLFNISKDHWFSQLSKI